MKQLHTLLLIVTLIGLIACEKSSEEPPKKRPPQTEQADQGILFYLSGQSLLPYFRDTNIKAIRQAIDQYTLYNSRLMVYIQPSRSESLLIEYSFDYDTQMSRADTLKRYNGKSSIEKSHMVEVLNDFHQFANAKQYGMVIGTHGGGWVPAEWTDLTQSEVEDEFNGDEWSYRPDEKGVPFDWLHKSPGAEATRWLGEHAGNSTDISTWVEAFDEATIDLEYLIFDVCFMSNIEALYELRHAARYIVASPCEIMGRGTDYLTGLPTLLTDEGTSYNLQAWCEAFYQFYSTTTDTRQSGCIALTDCRELEALAEATRAILATSHKHVSCEELQSYEGLFRTLFVDFGQYIEAICQDEALLSQFWAQFDRTFPEASRLHTPSFYSGYNGSMNEITYYSGVSTSAPSTKYPKAYAATEWYQRVYPAVE